MNIKKRLLPAAIIVILTVGCTLLCRETRMLFFAALAAVSALELANVLGKAELPASRELLIVYIVIHSVLCYLRVPVLWLVAWYAFAAFAAMLWGILRHENGAPFAVGTVFALLWPFGFYALTLHAAASELWLPVLALAVLGTWACDSMALIGGKLLGKHKLAPRVSPHKTWEGAITGGVFAVAAGCLICLMLRKSCPLPMPVCMLVTLVASTFGQIGDLAASLIKRMAGVKDYGHLMPEHGGIMDKMDSMLFAIPAAYLILYLYMA